MAPVSKKTLAKFGVAALVIVFVAVFVVPARRVEGSIKSVYVEEGIGYTLTVLGDDGKEYKAVFPGGNLGLDERCEIRRASPFSDWKFAEYLPNSPKPARR